MSLLALILNGAWAARSRRANLELATKVFRNQLPLAVTALALVLFIMAAHLPQVALAAATGTWSQTGSLATYPLPPHGHSAAQRQGPGGGRGM